MYNVNIWNGGVFLNILLVEDDEMIAKGLIYSLGQSKYALVHKADVKSAVEFLKTEKPELIILDVSLPDGDGFSLYNEHIKNKSIPTIFLTAKDEEDNVVKGLELGADDYVTKPFSTRELIARINKIILRKKKNQIIKVKDISFDLDKMVVYKDKTEILLTGLELKILHLLFMNLNKVVKRSYIIDKVWEWTGNDINDNTVTVYLKRIREKLGSNIIITIKGVGYRIDEDEKQD